MRKHQKNIGTMIAHYFSIKSCNLIANNNRYFVKARKKQTYRMQGVSESHGHM